MHNRQGPLPPAAQPPGRRRRPHTVFNPSSEADRRVLRLPMPQQAPWQTDAPQEHPAPVRTAVWGRAAAAFLASTPLTCASTPQQLALPSPTAPAQSTPCAAAARSPKRERSPASRSWATMESKPSPGEAALPTPCSPVAHDDRGFGALADSLRKVLPRIDAADLSDKWRLLSEHLDSFHTDDDAASLAAAAERLLQAAGPPPSEPTRSRIALTLMLTEQLLRFCAESHTALRPVAASVLTELLSCIYVNPPQPGDLARTFRALWVGGVDHTLLADRFNVMTYLAAASALARQRTDAESDFKRSDMIKQNQMSVMNVAITFWQRRVLQLVLRSWRQQVAASKHAVVVAAEAQRQLSEYQSLRKEREGLDEALVRARAERDDVERSLVQARLAAQADRDRMKQLQSELTSRTAYSAELSRQLADQAPLIPLREEIARLEKRSEDLSDRLRASQETVKTMREAARNTEGNAAKVSELEQLVVGLRDQIADLGTFLAKVVWPKFFSFAEVRLRNEFTGLLSAAPGVAALMDWLNRVVAAESKGPAKPKPLRDLSSGAALLSHYLLLLRKVAPQYLTQEELEAAMPPAPGAAAAGVVSATLEKLKLPTRPPAELLNAGPSDHLFLISQMFSRFCDSATAGIRELPSLGPLVPQQEQIGEPKERLSAALRSAGLPEASPEEMSSAWWSRALQRSLNGARRWADFNTKTQSKVAASLASKKAGGSSQLSAASFTTLMAETLSDVVTGHEAAIECAELGEVLEDHIAEVRGAYTRYSRLDAKGEAEHEVPRLSSDEFILMLRDANLMRRKGGLQRRAALRVFAASRTDDGAPETERTLGPGEFAESLIRLAVLIGDPAKQSLRSLLRKLLDEHIAVVAYDDAEASEFRAVVRGSAVQAVLKQYKPALTRVYRHYAAQIVTDDPTASSVLEIEEFEMFVQAMQILDGTVLTKERVWDIFVKIQDDDDPQAMVYSEFCEAVVVLAMIKIPYCHIPTAERITRFLDEHLARLSEVRGVLSAMQPAAD